MNVLSLIIKYSVLDYINKIANMMVPKKRVRICSVNNDKRKALTECTLDLNISPSSPSESTYSQKMHYFLKAKPIDTQTDQNMQQVWREQRIQKRKGRVKRDEDEIKFVQKNESKNYTNAEFQKLIQITSRCVDYYNRQMETKEAQLKVVQEAFQDIHDRLNRAFNGIIVQVQNKHNQIKEFLHKKQAELIQIKKDQEAELNTNLNDVKSVQLMNLLSDYKNSQNTVDLSQQICTYASTLYRFYEAMQRIEKQNFKQGVEQTINFINNIISEEIKYIVYEKIPNKSLNGSFSFNDGLGFGNSITSPIERRGSAEMTNSLVSDDDHFGIKRGKETRQGWTQTLGEIEGKHSVLQLLNEIVKNQGVMKEKIMHYRENRN